MRFSKNLAAGCILIYSLVLLTGCTSPTPTVAPSQPAPTLAAPTLAVPTLAVPAAAPTAVPTILPTTSSTTIPTRSPGVPPSAVPSGSEVSFSLTWYGQSTFVLNTSSGLKVLMDPAGTGTGYKIPTIDGVDLVAVSHEHSDHNAMNLASGNPLVLRGLAGGDWAKIDQMIKDVRVYSVATFHDGKQGAERGKNAVFLFDLKGLRLAHCGDLGHVLSAEQAKALGAVDILIIPVGGYYTIDAKAAAETIKLVNPKAVVPMHYKTADLSANLAGVLAPVDDFVKAISGETAVIDSGQTVAFVQGKLPEKRTVYILKYK